MYTPSFGIDTWRSNGKGYRLAFFSLASANRDRSKQELHTVTSPNLTLQIPVYSLCWRLIDGQPLAVAEIQVWNIIRPSRFDETFPVPALVMVFAFTFSFVKMSFEEASSLLQLCVWPFPTFRRWTSWRTYVAPNTLRLGCRMIVPVLLARRGNFLFCKALGDQQMTSTEACKLCCRSRRGAWHSCEYGKMRRKRGSRHP